jgi:cytidyltransferase-like protein
VNTSRTVAALRAELVEPRRHGWSIGLVPTMGAFHEGHLSLMRRARDACDVVVVSLFVNPAQFNEATDLEIYPRDEARDAALAAEVGVDHLFAPGVAEVYPDGFATAVAVHGLTDGLEGAHRGHGHFDGVTTVVSKLLNMVGPDVAYFGQKDAQQAAVVRGLVRDLNFPVRIEFCPTVAPTTALRCRAATCSSPPPSGPRPPRCRARYAPCSTLSPPASATRWWRPPPGSRSWPPPAWSPSTWRSWRPTIWSLWRPWTATCWWPWPLASAPSASSTTCRSPS